MTKEQLRMQMLAGIITESQYKEEIEEIDSMGRIGKSYSAPGAEDSISNENSKEPKVVKNLKKVISDVSQNNIFIGEHPEYDDLYAVFYNSKDSFYKDVDGKKIECLNRIPYMGVKLKKISEYPNATPSNKYSDLQSIYRILSAHGGTGKWGCPDLMNDNDGKYILIPHSKERGYITRKGEGKGLRQGPKYDLGMGLEFTLL